MPSPPVPTCFPDNEALTHVEGQQPAASSMSCWGFDLKGPESIRVGSGLNRLDGGQNFFREEADLLEFLSIPTCVESLDSELPQPGASTSLPSRNDKLSSLPSVADPTPEGMKKCGEERTIQLGSHPSYGSAVRDTLNSELAGGDLRNQTLAKNVHSGRDPFSIVTSIWDGGTISPHEAFLNYDHAYKKLEDEATRRVPHDWINNSDITLKTRWPDEPSLTMDSSPRSDQRFTFDTNAIYSCNPSPGKRVLKSPDESTISQFSLPPQCVPKNAIRWTHYNITTSGSPSKDEAPLISAGGNPASANFVEKGDSREPNVFMKDKMPPSTGRQSISFDTPTSLSTTGPSDLLPYKTTCITPNCEEFSTSSEDETSTLDTEPTVLEVCEKIEQPTRHLGRTAQIGQGSHTEKSMNNFSLIPSSTKSSNKPSRGPKAPEWYRLDAAFDESPTGNSHMISSGQIQIANNDLVKPSEAIIFEPELPTQSAHPCKPMEGDKSSLDGAEKTNVSRDNITITRGNRSSEETESYNRSPSSSHANTARETKTSSKTGQAKSGDQVRKGRRAASSYHNLSPYPRVTRSSVGLGSRKGISPFQSSTTPGDSPGRDTPKKSKCAAQSDCLVKPRRSLSQIFDKGLDDSSSSIHSTVPIMCGHVDEKTGGKCETMFKRPYDLVRHKETIHDSEGPEGDRKPQWRCSQCGGGFSRKDALIRHCRTRKH